MVRPILSSSLSPPSCFHSVLHLSVFSHLPILRTFIVPATAVLYHPSRPLAISTRLLERYVMSVFPPPKPLQYLLLGFFRTCAAIIQSFKLRWCFSCISSLFLPLHYYFFSHSPLLTSLISSVAVSVWSIFLSSILSCIYSTYES